MWNKIAVAATLVGMTACMDGASVLDDNNDSTQTQYLFGLSESELLAVYPLVAEQHDEASWLAFNQAPFECGRYGDLCRMVGEQAAQDITRDALHAAVAGSDLATIVTEMDRKTESARVALASLPEAGGARASDVDWVNYPCGNHRLRIETYKTNPAFGARYGMVTCTHQADLGSGIWGGSQTTNRMTGYVKILGVSPLEDSEVTQTDTHSISTLKVYPGLNQTVAGSCTGDHGGDIVTVLENRS